MDATAPNCQRAHHITESGERVIDGPGLRRCVITRGASPDKKLFTAVVAYPAELGIVPGRSLEDASNPVPVPADLTDVVLRLRDFWIAMPGSVDVHSVCERTHSEIDKRIAVLLRDGFFEFSQFLCGIEVLTLQLQQHGVVSEQTLLGCEQLLVDLRNCSSRLIEVSDAEGADSDLLGGLERGNRRAD